MPTELPGPYVTILKVKVKWSRYRPGVAQRVGRGIALLFHDRSTRRWWVVSSTSRLHFTPGKDPVPIVQEAGWTPGLVWTGGKSRPPRIRSRTVQPVASRYTDWATRPTCNYITYILFNNHLMHNVVIKHYSDIIWPQFLAILEAETCRNSNQ